MKKVFSRLIYKALDENGEPKPYDEERPEFDCYMPVFSGDFEVVDCWVCDEHGNKHEGYNVSPVPVHTDLLGDLVGRLE